MAIPITRFQVSLRIIVPAAFLLAIGAFPLEGAAASAAQVVAGDAFTCALTVAQGAKCWGDNGSGEVGDNTNVTPRLTAVDVFGLAGGVAAIGAGDSHACAITSAGAAKCWGDNGSGQLGDGTTTQSRQPVAVLTLGSGAVAIAGGRRHSCAVVTGGGAKCWGENLSGQVGIGSAGGNQTSPVAVQGLSSGVTAIATGRDHSCALVAGVVKCWGGNSKGQLGDDTLANRSSPGDVLNLGGVAVAIAAGSDHTCALMQGGGAKCWGDNSTGQLGNNSTSSSSRPVTVSGFSNGVAIGAGEGHTCAVASGGSLQCWGDNSSGQLGDGTTAQSLVPKAVSGISVSAVAPAAGKFHTCAVIVGGGLKCWGGNASGQLGDGLTTPRSSPGDVVGFSAASTTQYTLSVSSGGTGSGTVTSTPSGISCGTTCSASFDSGTSVTLSAAPASGSTFAGWGGACSGTASCVVVMSAAKSVTAAFNASASSGSSLGNISTRGRVLTGDDVMIGGFIISGDSPKTVLVRARGPSMIPAGVLNALLDPQLTLVDQAANVVIATNDNWGDATNAGAILATGKAPTDPREAAILITLNPGAYTAIVSGVGNTTGVGIVEVFAQ